jgi:Ca2+/Na+ antiporter
VDPFSVSTRQDLGIALVAVGTGLPTLGVSVGAARTHGAPTQAVGRDTRARTYSSGF